MTLLPDARTVAVILAGGRGSRAGDVDKAFLMLLDRPLIQCVLERVRPQVDGVVINANGPTERFAPFDCDVWADMPVQAAATGPFLGLVSTIERLSRQRGPRVRFLLTVPTDTPFLPADLARRLQRGLDRAKAAGAYAIGADGEHPTVALWDSAAFPRIIDLFRRQPTRSMRDLVQSLGCVPVHFGDDVVRPFFNINTLDELWTAEQLLSASCDNGPVSPSL
jgi:molybdenum cofactor guanylyltransferase